MPRMRSTCAVLIASLIGGCQANPPSAPPSSIGPVATVRPTATPKPTIAGPAVTLTLDTSGPIVGSDAGIAGHPYASPAAAARDAGGGYVLFIVWSSGEPGSEVVTVARSQDGRTWRVGKTAILSAPGKVPPGAVRHVPTAAVQLQDGTWQLYGWATLPGDPQSEESWRASAPTPEGPWAIDAREVLLPGAPGAWDSQVAAVGAVQRSSSGYALWYEGAGPGSGVRGDIGSATSSDGLVWQKADDPTTTSVALDASDPVIHRGVCGPGTSLALYQPQVELAPGGYIGAVGAYGISDDFAVFGLTSIDGVTWRCGSTAPILRPSDIPGSNGLHALASMPLDDGSVALLIESLGDKHSDIWLATMSVAH